MLNVEQNRICVEDLERGRELLLQGVKGLEPWPMYAIAIWWGMKKQELEAKEREDE